MDWNNRKHFLLAFAAERGFDPTIPSNWDTVTVSDLRAKTVLFQYSEIFYIIALTRTSPCRVGTDSCKYIKAR